MPDERDRMIGELAQESRLLARQMVRFYDAVADQLGLHISDLACLSLLRDRGRARFSELSADLGLTTGAVSRMVNRLEQGGFIRRAPDPTDRRRVIVELVSADAVAGLFAGQAAHITEFADGFSDEQLRFLLTYIRQRTGVFRSEADRLRREGKPHATRRGRS